MDDYGSPDPDKAPSPRPSGPEDDTSAIWRGLFVAHCAGDPLAFEQLYRSLAPELHRYLKALAADASWAEELVQETFIQLHRSRHTFDPALPFRPWAFAIARYVFLMARRARTRLAGREVAIRESASSLEPAHAPEAESIVTRRTLEHWLARLPQSLRLSVVLHHLLGLDFKQVAGRLGISESSARARSSRGMARLRALAGEEER